MKELLLQRVGADPELPKGNTCPLFQVGTVVVGFAKKEKYTEKGGGPYGQKAAPHADHIL